MTGMLPGRTFFDLIKTTGVAGALEYIGKKDVIFIVAAVVFLCVLLVRVQPFKRVPVFLAASFWRQRFPVFFIQCLFSILHGCPMATPMPMCQATTRPFSWIRYSAWYTQYLYGLKERWKGGGHGCFRIFCRCICHNDRIGE